MEGRKFGAMFDGAYMERATEMMKSGDKFFWEPSQKWYLAAQREHKVEKYTKTFFEVMPFWHETRFELWPVKASVNSIRFKQPWPNLIMLYHEDMCVWNRGVAKPRNPDGSVNLDGVVKLDLGDLWTQPIITFHYKDPKWQAKAEELRLNWNLRKRIRYQKDVKG